MFTLVLFEKETPQKLDIIKFIMENIHDKNKKEKG